MKHVAIIAALLVTVSLPALAASLEDREKDAERAVQICAQHIMGASHSTGYYIPENTSFTTISGTVAVSASATVQHTYDTDWDHCYAIDKLRVDLAKERQAADKEFVDALSQAVQP